LFTIPACYLRKQTIESNGDGSVCDSYISVTVFAFRELFEVEAKGTYSESFRTINGDGLRWTHKGEQSSDG
jgi:hypothetical protein